MGEEKIRHLNFTKMSGAGNDFVILDNRNGVVSEPDTFAQRICDRRNGVGADGVLLLENSPRADFMMKYYNADGSYGGMCGNGGRCISRFAFSNKIVSRREMSFEALDHIYSASIIEENVRLKMKNPVDIRLHQRIGLAHGEIKYHFINSGSPHCVIFVDENLQLGKNVSDVDVSRLGREIRVHSSFSPEGTNVNFVDVKNSTTFQVRTYERGVEAETLACGTGSVAVALIANLVRSAASPVKIQVKSGEDLSVGFVRKSKSSFEEITLFGSAHIAFSGILKYNFQSHSIADIV